jgi:hypothetical protein
MEDFAVKTMSDMMLGRCRCAAVEVLVDDFFGCVAGGWRPEVAVCWMLDVEFYQYTVLVGICFAFVFCDEGRNSNSC